MCHKNVLLSRKCIKTRFVQGVHPRRPPDNAGGTYYASLNP